MSRRSNVIVTICGLALALGCRHGPSLSKDDLGRQVGFLREEVKALEEQNKTLTDQQKALASQVEQLSKRQGPPQAVSPPAAEMAPVPPAANPPAPAPPRVPVRPPAAKAAATPANRDKSQDPQLLYQQAMDLYRAGETVEAAVLFGRFVRQFPESDLADNAQYWMGECSYSQKEYGQALENFKLVSARFPGGNKVPDALYKQGVCERLLGREPEARRTFQSIVDRFPGTEFSDWAKSALARP